MVIKKQPSKMTSFNFFEVFMLLPFSDLFSFRKKQLTKSSVEKGRSSLLALRPANLSN